MVEQADKVREAQAKTTGAQERPTPLEALEQTSTSGIAALKQWVQENQGMAMAVAFAVGVFLGVLWRR